MTATPQNEKRDRSGTPVRAVDHRQDDKDPSHNDIQEDSVPHDVVDPEAPHWRREHFIPVRKMELIQLLAKKTGLTDPEREEFLQVCRVLDATLHFEYQRQLDHLKEAYAPFNPDSDTRTLRERSEEQLEELSPRVFDSFTYLLKRANYERLTRDQIQNVVGAASDWGVRLQVDLEIFDRLEVFVRGDIIGQRTRRRLRNLYRLETVDVEIYQRLIVAFRLSEEATEEDLLDRPRPIFVKLFKNIPKQDVDMLLPGTQIKLTLVDRGRIALPTLSGLAMAAVKIVKGTVLAAMFGGITGLIAFFAFVIGTIGYGVKSFFGYLHTKDKYQLNLTRNLYYQNLDNNAGVVYRLLDEAEEQECREAVLAYFMLWRHAGPEGWPQEKLDAEAERFLIDKVGLDKVDFETHDAVAKLLRLGIAYETAEGHVCALPADVAVAQLDRSWDSCFTLDSVHPSQSPPEKK